MRFGNAPTCLFVLDGAQALAAFAAAIFWFLSASSPPPMKSYFGGAPADDPFFVALQESARLNGYAALCAAVAAVLFGIVTLVRRRKVATWFR
jgi:hypothetical protein